MILGLLTFSFTIQVLPRDLIPRFLRGTVAVAVIARMYTPSGKILLSSPRHENSLLNSPLHVHCDIKAIVQVTNWTVDSEIRPGKLNSQFIVTASMDF
jgi:hypothetical protein